MKNMMKCISYMFREEMKFDKRQVQLDVLTGLLQLVRTLVNLFLPAAVLTLVTMGEGTGKALIAAAAINVALALISYGWEHTRWNLNMRASEMTNYQLWKLNCKAMDADYIDTEQSEEMTKYYRARDSIWETGDVTYMLLNVVLCNAIKILVVFLVFSRVHILVALVVAATVVLEYLWDALWTSKKGHEQDGRVSVASGRRKHLDSLFFDQKALRDMVFHPAREFLLRKRSGLTSEILDARKKKEDIDLVDSIVCALLALIRTVAVYLIAMRQFLAGSLPIASFLVFTGAAHEMTQGLYMISTAFSYVRRAAYYYEDYARYMELPERDREGRDSAPGKVHTVEFRNVSFRYPNREEDALHDVSLKLDTDQVTAIVGENGAGKSTFVKLLLRLYRVSEGDILLDGKSIYEYDYQEYIRLFAPVFQDFKLFAFTVGENICLGREVDGIRLEEILKKVGLQEKIGSLPKGLETDYTKRFQEDGVLFSGGEEQKLAIARAYAKGEDAALIFDEPTSALDSLMEYEINQLICGPGEGRFGILISHRLGNTRFAQKIVVLDHGRVAEEGSHDELMAREKGLYKKLYEMQSSYYKS